MIKGQEKMLLCSGPIWSGDATGRKEKGGTGLARYEIIRCLPWFLGGEETQEPHRAKSDHSHWSIEWKERNIQSQGTRG
jgi:hypothetical protein